MNDICMSPMGLVSAADRLEIATQYVEAGLSALPVRLPRKSPAVTSWTEYESRTPSANELARWYCDETRTGVGIVCGMVSGGVEVIDFDGGGIAYADYVAHVDAVAPGLLDSLLTERTPSGGYHVAYRIDTTAVGGEMPGSTVWAYAVLTSPDGSPVQFGAKTIKLAAGESTTRAKIETRAEGGFIVTAPTDGYTIQRGDWRRLPVISWAQREILRTVAAMFDESKPVEQHETNGEFRAATSEGKPGADYNARGDVRALLQRHGWQYSHGGGENEHWTRPGKDPRAGTSATLRKSDRRLYVFSTNAFPLEDRKSYSPFALLAALEHGGDFASAARALGEQGYGEPDRATSSTATDATRSTTTVEQFEPERSSTLDDIPILRLSDLRRDHAEQRQILVEHLLRVGETMNVISDAKAGKSWLVHDLAMRLLTGGRWIDSFDCSPCNVVLADVELYPDTLRARLSHVAAALGVDDADIEERLRVLPLRGRGVTIEHFAPLYRRCAMPADRPTVVIVDALYRVLPHGAEENSNEDMMRVFNRLDALAHEFGVAQVVVHHASKGTQGNKSVMDTGSGAGAIGRAADSHLVLRAHEREGVYVVDLRARTFPPTDPLCIERVDRIWRRTDDDPAQLRREHSRGGRPRKAESGPQPFAALMNDAPAEPESRPWDYRRLANELVDGTPRTASALAARASDAGIGQKRFDSLLAQAVGAGLVAKSRHPDDGRAWMYSSAESAMFASSTG